MKRKLNGVEDPFANASEGERHIAQDTSAVEIDRATYGKVDIPPSGREVVKPINIFNIYPDLVQPRRAIPLRFRNGWNGTPNRIPEMLRAWMYATNLEMGKTVEYARLINGTAEIDVPEGDGEHVDLFDLVSLAASIFREGLTNPIAITKTMGSTDAHILIAGERRFLAVHLIYMHIKELGTVAEPLKSGNIPARILPKRDVWAQASENGARKQLTAIAMARQLALLIFDMYEGENTGFKPISYWLENGVSDRLFYAQVANGDAWRIKKGLTQRILDVTGLKRPSAISEYRKLLTIPDSVWHQADAENWSLGRIQSYMGWKNANPTAQYELPSSPVTHTDSFEISKVSQSPAPPALERSSTVDKGFSEKPQPEPEYTTGAMVGIKNTAYRGAIIGMRYSSAMEMWVYRLKNHPQEIREDMLVTIYETFEEPVRRPLTQAPAFSPTPRPEGYSPTQYDEAIFTPATKKYDSTPFLSKLDAMQSTMLTRLLSAYSERDGDIATAITFLHSASDEKIAAMNLDEVQHITHQAYEAIFNAIAQSEGALRTMCEGILARYNELKGLD